jgi:hypothetical protein
VTFANSTITADVATPADSIASVATATLDATADVQLTADIAPISIVADRAGSLLLLS